MSINATIRIAIAASVVAISVAAPAAFAQSSDNAYRPEGGATDTTSEQQKSQITKVRHVKHMKHKHHRKMMRHHRATSPASDTTAAPKY